jgi:hypothetical protein
VFKAEGVALTPDMTAAQAVENIVQVPCGEVYQHTTFARNADGVIDG